MLARDPRSQCSGLNHILHNSRMVRLSVYWCLLGIIRTIQVHESIFRVDHLHTIRIDHNPSPTLALWDTISCCTKVKNLVTVSTGPVDLYRKCSPR